MKTRKILSIVLAFVLMLAIAVPMTAFAATNDGTITITNTHPNTTIAGKTYTAYLLLDVVQNGTSYAYSIPDEYKSNTTLVSLLDQLLDDPSQSEVEALAPQLKAQLAGLTVNKSVTVGNDAETATITALRYGYYMVLGGVDATEEAGGGSLIASIALTTVSKDAIVNPKADAPSLGGDEGDSGKMVSNDNGTSWDTNADAKIGDIVKFKVQSHVPEIHYAYTSYTFKFVDVMDAGLTFSGDTSVSVTIGGGAALTLGDDYTVDGLGTAASPLVIDLSDCIMAQHTGDLIVVEYTAMLNENASVVAANKNSVTLKYSNDPYCDDEGGTLDPPEGETPPEITKVYTTDINIYKTNNDGTSPVALLGAGFTLTQGVEKIKFMEVGTGTGVYRVAKTGETGFVTEVFSPASGKIQLKGLDHGTYVLEETTVPTIPYNFNKAADTTIEITYSNCVFTKTPNGEINVRNKSGSQLPGTGGIGEMLFVIIGLAVIALFGTGYVVYRKKSALSGLKSK